MIRRRRLKHRSTSAQPVAPVAPSNPSEEIQRALRLGWAVAETFGRLRVYQPEYASKRNDPHELPRFSYSNGDLSGAQRLEVSYRQLVELSAALKLQPPEIADLAHFTADTVPALSTEQKKQIHGALEAWSRTAWIQLNVRSAALGRAMTYGGSMADTYWYMAQPAESAFLSGRQSAEALLRPHRLQRIQERMAELNEAFSDELCSAIGHSIEAWKWDAQKEAWTTANEWSQVGVAVQGRPARTPAQQIHFNLFRQVRTWRDLLFASRQPSDYVSPGFRRRANLLAGTITILMVLLIAVAVGFLVFSVFSLALVAVDRLNIGSQVQSEFIEAISVFLSLVSTLAIVIASLLSRASTAVHQFDTWLENTIVQRSIQRATTIPWDEPPRKTAE
ncbi:MAG TPA: hypothetical protein VFZ66_08295 [Herpetosiphonaceae bacterium]